MLICASHSNVAVLAAICVLKKNGEKRKRRDQRRRTIVERNPFATPGGTGHISTHLNGPIAAGCKSGVQKLFRIHIYKCTRSNRMQMSILCGPGFDVQHCNDSLLLEGLCVIVISANIYIYT